MYFIIFIYQISFSITRVSIFAYILVVVDGFDNCDVSSIYACMCKGPLI